MNYLITKRGTAWNPTHNWKWAFGFQDMSKGKVLSIRDGGGFLDLCRQTLVISITVDPYGIVLKTWNRHCIVMNEVQLLKTAVLELGQVLGVFAPNRLLKKPRNNPVPYSFIRMTRLYWLIILRVEGCSINFTRWLVRAWLCYLDKV